MAIETDSKFTDYLAIFRGRVRDQRIGETEDAHDSSPLRPLEISFTDVFLETLEDIGQLTGLEIAYLERKLGRANCKVNAYGISETDAHVDLVITVHDGQEPDELQSVPSSDVDSAVKKALQVFRATKKPIHREMEPSSPVYDMMEQFNKVHDSVRTIRVTVLVDGIVKRVAKFKQPNDLPDVLVDVWDLQRLFRADSSGLTYESFTVDLEELLGAPLPCLSATNKELDHRCYLAIIPGELLHDLYHMHGPRLLELNVRSFLQSRGKVNRGIRDTILGDPGHFLAFNNGISITAEELGLRISSDGSLSISSIKGLQIVNGGQTVASIHRAKNRDKANLSQIEVQAKITVVEPGHHDDLVPFISRYSNTQNKVNETDFSANHPFHVRIQQLSEQIWIPGETSRWFYERARGQWEVARAREGTTAARVRTFDQKAPRKQKVDKTLLAKAVNTWNEQPQVVSRGGQKSFVHFMESVTDHGSTWQPDESYYRKMISKVIIFKQAEKIARQIGFSAYRANAVAYTVALLAWRTSDRVNLDAIWDNQQVSDSLKATLSSWMPEVHEEIVESAGDRNVTEWCKKKECWTQIQSMSLSFEAGFENELAEGLPMPTVGRQRKSSESASNELTPEERDRQATTMRYGPQEWIKIMDWGRESGNLTTFQRNIAATILGYSAGGWRQVPSPKQTRHTVEMIDSWNATRGGEESQ
ncbi:AIPR family protein [Planctomycetaceae bacterium]|nr:AIPR family protein [Planctomycetaceae bacterium]